MMDTKQIELPNGKTYSFGPPSFSLELCEFLEVCKKMDEGDESEESSHADFMSFISKGIQLAKQSLVNGGHTEDEAREALASIPASAEWMEKIRDVLGLR